MDASLRRHALRAGRNHSLREPSQLNGKAVHAESLVAIDVPMVLERAFPRSAGFRPLVKPRVRPPETRKRTLRRRGQKSGSQSPSQM